MGVSPRASHKWEYPMPTNRLPYCVLCDSMIPVRDTREFHTECTYWKFESLFTHQPTDDVGYPAQATPRRIKVLKVTRMTSFTPSQSSPFLSSDNFTLFWTISHPLCHFHSLDVAKRWAKISMLDNPTQHFARKRLFILHTISTMRDHVNWGKSCLAKPTQHLRSLTVLSIPLRIRNQPFWCVLPSWASNSPVSDLDTPSILLITAGFQREKERFQLIDHVVDFFSRCTRCERIDA